MMKPAIAKQLGGQRGEYLKSDSRFPGYLCIRVQYPLGKLLLPNMAMKVKGRGQMVITLMYENVPHFCFSCGRIDHAAVNCEAVLDAQRVTYGEELRASPPCRTKEITVKPMASRFTRPLFQVTNMPMQGKLNAGTLSGGGTPGGTNNVFTKAVAEDREESKQEGTGEKIVNIIKELLAACNSAEASWVAASSVGKERVSFGTNMSTEEDSSDGASVD